MFVFLFLSKCRKNFQSSGWVHKSCPEGKQNCGSAGERDLGLTQACHFNSGEPHARGLWCGLVFLPEGLGSGQNTSTRQSKQVTSQSFCSQLCEANIQAAYRSCPHGSLPHTANPECQPPHHMGSLFEDKLSV